MCREVFLLKLQKSWTVGVEEFMSNEYSGRNVELIISRGHEEYRAGKTVKVVLVENFKHNKDVDVFSG